jgi:hypothetical protein
MGQSNYMHTTLTRHWTETALMLPLCLTNKLMNIYCVSTQLCVG